MKTEYIKKLIEESSKLMDFSLCMQMATKYSCGKEINYTYFSWLLQEARKEINEYDK